MSDSWSMEACKDTILLRRGWILLSILLFVLDEPQGCQAWAFPSSAASRRRPVGRVQSDTRILAHDGFQGPDDSLDRSNPLISPRYLTRRNWLNCVQVTTASAFSAAVWPRHVAAADHPWKSVGQGLIDELTLAPSPLSTTTPPPSSVTTDSPPPPQRWPNALSPLPLAPTENEASANATAEISVPVMAPSDLQQALQRAQQPRRQIDPLTHG